MKKPPAKRSNPQSSAEQGNTHRIEVQSHTWQAPLPPPSVLDDFNRVVPGCAERIISAWEVESQHRREIERREQRSYYQDALVSKTYALVFVLAALALSAWAVEKNQSWVGVLLGAGTIVSVVLAFIRGRKTKA